MKDFIMAAFPYIITGICIAVMAVQMNKKDSGNEGKKEETYMLEGMCIGICLGTNIGVLGMDNIGMGMSMGMLIGEVIGMMIPKNKENK